MFDCRRYQQEYQHADMRYRLGKINRSPPAARHAPCGFRLHHRPIGIEPCSKSERDRPNKGRPLATTFSEPQDAELDDLAGRLVARRDTGAERADLRSAGRPMTIVCRTHPAVQVRVRYWLARPLRTWPMVEKGNCVRIRRP